MRQVINLLKSKYMKVLICCKVGFTLSLFLVSVIASAQCPAEDEIKILASNQQSFEEGQGTLTFSFKQPLFSEANRKLYRIRLYDKDSQRYIYDDNHFPSQNKVTIDIITHLEMKIEGLSAGSYALEIHGQECQHSRYDIATQLTSTK